MVYTQRHHQVFNPDHFHLPVHVVGCGGMGSHIATALTRMGIGQTETPIYLHDFDSYELHNVANQAIDVDKVEMKKVFGLEAQLKYIEPNLNVVTVPYKVEPDTVFSGVVFLCLDSMEERQVIVDHCLEGKRDVKCVIETRMDAETGISHCFNPNNPQHMDCWWMYWYPDAHTEATPGCGGPQSIVSAIYGTSCYALKQFELFSRKRGRAHIKHRIYADFRYPDDTRSERWSERWAA
tara:strand:- start:5568 stop:6278 length:711 start_codon:yes stop_codon:yes gene_type:complete